MMQIIKLKYTNPQLQIGLLNWRTVYLLQPRPVPLHLEVERGRLVYRVKGSSRRISYALIKKGVIKKAVTIQKEVPAWLIR